MFEELTKEVLKFINDKLTDRGINYDFDEKKPPIVHPYFVGDYSDLGSSTEDGLFESEFTLNGFTRGEWLTLENAREIIEELFSDCTTILENGSGVSISYSGCLIIPTGDSELKRIQITLNIKEWKVTI